MSLSTLLILLAVIMFGLGAFVPRLNTGRLIAGGLFSLALSQLLVSGFLGLS